MPDTTILLLQQFCDAVVETIEEFPDGAPAGPLYMAFAEAGMSLNTFESVMSVLVMAGRIRKSGHQYFPVKK